MPGSRGAAGESRADPFTGSTRYVPAGASTDTAGCCLLFAVAESLGLSQKDAQFRNNWRRRIKG